MNHLGVSASNREHIITYLSLVPITKSLGVATVYQCINKQMETGMNKTEMNILLYMYFAY